MNRFFQGLNQRIGASSRLTRSQKALGQCTCGQPIFFRNSQCLYCQAPLGYEPERSQVVTLATTYQADIWCIDAEPQWQTYKRCANLNTAAGCNWLLPASANATLCCACRLNRTIPDLSVTGNDLRWARFESAKRRLVAQLLNLNLPLLSKGEDEINGLAFDFLGPNSEGQLPTTGHQGGLITLNIEEADDDERERIRIELHEPYRTLLGHFRHEVGHYYWDRLIADSYWLEDFRRLFGDERVDYSEALSRHYNEGAPGNWQSAFVSAYASSHPWEDWAETWAHYLHMMDALDTALSFGMSAGDIELDFCAFSYDALYDPGDPLADEFLQFINAWIELAAMLNELARSMGQKDLYPFVLAPAVIGKLQFIHRVVQGTSP